MNKYIFYIILSFIIYPRLSFAENEKNYTPSVTVRGVFTGFVFKNNLPAGKEESVRYDLVEVNDPDFPLSQYPYGIVQFRERGGRGGDLCALSGKDKDKIIMFFCSPGGDKSYVETYFSLIPTNTGAVLIKNIATGKCMSADSVDIGFPNLEKCMLSPSQSGEIYRQLWFLAPPFSASGMSPLL
ncbi:hypothetical protein PH97_004742 [Salmonella enterica subsp. enterica]|nr:hypothetical protein [Salmonella enterica subsp. enterica serovar Hvittingfoss]EEJ7167042.1 hypothetical protein [Salmonella enterica subsp. enterica serovar Hvittingfoss]EKO1959969.1 hypothetical protein [Salmonella enterica]